MNEQPVVHLFGIRHHGPGSARSLIQALEQLAPDCLLIEGPPEADALIPMIAQADMEPPVALLLYAKDAPAHAVFYPFARYSPEWQALRYGLRHNIATCFFDLPVTYRLAHDMSAEGIQADNVEIEAERLDEEGEASDPFMPTARPQPPIHNDPLSWLARAAGYTDGERWWEQLVEERIEGAEVFVAIQEAMCALRAECQSEGQNEVDIWEARREAQMRQNIRKAQKQGFMRIAVVCGAWHVPALQMNGKKAPKVKADRELLKGLSKCKVESTWIPWTSGRLARASGYGAGITSPGWYDHLWCYADAGGSELATRWLARSAQLLREEDLEASSAQVIDGVRLAEGLAAMRGRMLVGLDELNEAACALFANGNDQILNLIADKLIVGNVLGRVPDDIPITPLQRDLARLQKRLRLKASAVEKQIELDLRKPNALARSHLLHRLNLLGIPWGRKGSTRGKGTFKESWRLQWQPEFELRLIDAGRYGQTVEQASSAWVVESCSKAENLADLTALLDDTLLADLPTAIQHLVERIHEQAAKDSDLVQLMIALPRLVQVQRYGNVRMHKASDGAPDDTALEAVVKGLFARICIGLPNACSSLADDAAINLFEHLIKVDSAVKILQDADIAQQWLETVEKLTRTAQVHALLKGRATKILFDENQFDSAQTAKHFSLALSNPDVEQAAAWLDGLLKDSGLLLVHDSALFNVLDSWFASLSDELFTKVLPLIRRTFSTFEAPERHNIGRKAKGENRGTPAPVHHLNHDRGSALLAHLAFLLGSSTMTDVESMETLQ